jgi:hypothetical protein
VIEQLPGWLNFILLTAFYFGIFVLLRGLFDMGINNKDLLIICMFYAGGYLSKYRNLGGGWRFW